MLKHIWLVEKNALARDLQAIVHHPLRGRKAFVTFDPLADTGRDTNNAIIAMNRYGEVNV